MILNEDFDGHLWFQGALPARNPEYGDADNSSFTSISCIAVHASSIHPHPSISLQPQTLLPTKPETKQKEPGERVNDVN